MTRQTITALRKSLNSTAARIGKVAVRQQLIGARIDRLAEDRVTRQQTPMLDPARVFDQRAKALMGEEGLTYEQAYVALAQREPQLFVAYKRSCRLV